MSLSLARIDFQCQCAMEWVIVFVVKWYLKISKTFCVVLRRDKQAVIRWILNVVLLICLLSRCHIVHPLKSHLHQINLIIVCVCVHHICNARFSRSFSYASEAQIILGMIYTSYTVMTMRILMNSFWVYFCLDLALHSSCSFFLYLYLEIYLDSSPSLSFSLYFFFFPHFLSLFAFSSLFSSFFFFYFFLLFFSLPLTLSSSCSFFLLLFFPLTLHFSCSFFLSIPAYLSLPP